MLFKKLNKESNIINFKEGCWANNIVFDEYITKNAIKMHGWYFNKEKLKKNSLVIKKFKEGYWYGRIKKIEWCNDSEDMFFADVKTITKKRMLSKSEQEYLENNNLINRKSIESD